MSATVAACSQAADGQLCGSPPRRRKVALTPYADPLKGLRNLSRATSFPASSPPNRSNRELGSASCATGWANRPRASHQNGAHHLLPGRSPCGLR